MQSFRKREFDGLLIVDFISLSHKPVDPKILQKKWEERYPDKPCHVISGYTVLDKIENSEPIETTCEKLFDSTAFIKIYIFTHSQLSFQPGELLSGYAISQKRPVLSTDKLAEVLEKIIGEQPVVVNLISCAAGRGTNKNATDFPEKSLATKLHEALYKKMDRDIPVVARTQLVAVVPETGEKVTYDNERSVISTAVLSTLFQALNPINGSLFHQILYYATKGDQLAQRKQPHSKVIFYEEKHQQIQADAYFFKHEKNLAKWKTKVIDTLAKAQQEIKTEKRKQLYEKWFGDFKEGKFSDLEEMTPHEIYDRLKEAQSDSDIKANEAEKSFIGGLFNNNSNSVFYDAISSLLQEGKYLFDVPYLEEKKIKKLD